MNSVDISDEIGQALSRAAVMKALDSSFSTDGLMSAKQEPSSTGGGASGSGSAKINSNVVKAFQELLGDNSNKTEKFFMEQLKGKSIILENVKSQTEATKFLAKEKRQTQRVRKMSRSALRAKGILVSDLNKMTVPEHQELMMMSNMWKSYARSLMKGCKSGAQLQARLLTGEFVGAELIVIENKDNVKMKGERGIVISNTANCFVIAVRTEKETIGLESIRDKSVEVDTNPTGRLSFKESSGIETSTSREKVVDARVRLRRLVKDSCILAMPLPLARGQKVVSADQHEMDDNDPFSNTMASHELSENGKVCLLYGVKWLPHVSCLSSDAFMDNNGGKAEVVSNSGAKRQRR